MNVLGSRRLLWGLLIALPIVVLTGCATPTVEPTATPTMMPPTATPTSEPTPEPTPEPTAAPTATEAAAGVANPASVYCEEHGGRLEIRTDEDGGQVGYCVFPDGSECEEWAFYRGECSPGGGLVDTHALTTTVQAELPEGAFDGVGVLSLKVPPDSPPLWAVFSQGMRNYNLDPVPGHFVAVYAHDDAGWQELARHALTSGDPEQLAPDYVMAVEQVQVAPGFVWLELQGGAGAHSGTYHLFRFDPQSASLTVVATNFNPSPGAGNVTDLNSDGVGEVVLNATDPYVFCYACGVRLIRYEVLRWDGSELVPVSLEPLPDSAPAELRTLNNRAVELAQAGLWKDALAAVDEAEALGVENATFAWNAILIRLTGEARRDTERPYPLLANVFYGDYAAALEEMRPYSPEQMFSPESPLIMGTVAEGWTESLADHIVEHTSAALTVKPELAAAYFLRGWARYLKDPADPQAREDVTRAAELAPDEPLFTFPGGGS